jgi:virginiamycin B lyase
MSRIGNLTSRVLAAGGLVICGVPGLLLLPAPCNAQPTLTFTQFHHPVHQTLWGGSPAIETGPDGALWFSAFDHLVRVATTGEMSDYFLPDDGVVYPNGRGILGIAVGADGALWFTESTPSRIGRITTGGIITEFQLLADRHPQRIAAGPDGALWFTEFRDRVGRITTAGVVTEYPLPPCGATCTPHPNAITAGPDGALWFTNLGDARIWRITTNGTLTRSAERFIVQVGDITVGPDAALWFTGPDTAGPDDHIGRITTTGAMSGYLLPLHPRPTFNGYNNLAPSSITTGPDGALWFTSARVNVIGRITTTGAVTLYELPAAPETTDAWVSRSITTGPDGALWITNRGAIVRAALPAGPLSVSIDVKPGSCANPVSVRSRGVLPAAIVGTWAFDVTTIAAETVRLNGVAPVRWSLDDVTAASPADCEGTELDGYQDLALKFPTPAIVAAMTRARGSVPVSVTVTGSLKPEYGGRPFSGTAIVTLIGRR